MDDNIAENIYGAKLSLNPILLTRSKNTFLHAQEKNSTSLYPGDATDRDYPDGDIPDCSLPSKGELEPDASQSGLQRYLWVGLSPKRSKEVMSATSARQQKSRKAVQLQPDAKALRVVVAALGRDAKPQQSYQAQFFVLLKRNTHGYAETRRISNDHVFYFSEFRSDNAATTTTAKKKAWNGAIRDLAQRQPHEEGSDLSKSTPLTLPRGASKGSGLPVIPREIDLAHEVQFYLTAYSITGHQWMLDQMEALMENHVPSLATSCIDPKILNFFDPERPCSQEDVTDVHAKVQSVWPEITMDAQMLFDLRQNLNKHKLSVPFRLGRSFLRVYQRKAVSTTPSISDILEDVKEVEAGLAPTTLDLPSDASEWAKLFKITSEILQQLVTHNKEYQKAVSDRLGPHMIGNSPEQIWQMFAQKPDTDAAKLYIVQISRYLDAANNAKCEDIGRKLEDLLAVFENLSV